MAPAESSPLTAAQRAVLAAWPSFQSAAAVTWGSVDRLVRALHHVDTLADLPDHDAAELLALMRRATTRLRNLRPASPRQGSA